MLRKAATLAADELVFDLEDAVVLDSKEAALVAVIGILAEWTGPAASVRVNPPRSPWCHVEVVALASLENRPASLVVPKVESPGDLAFLDRLLDGVEAATGQPAPLRIQALIETVTGLEAVREIAASSPRLDALILGYADLAASLGRSRDGAASLDLWLPAQETILTAACSNGLQAIDGPFLGTADDAPFRRAAERARALGFDGKWAIHPAQLTPLRELFTPDELEVARARAVLAALDRAAAESHAGAVALDGEMLDEASRRAARRTLARVVEAA